ncbi:MAG: sigma-E factor negative regulatory protein, partial [Pseudomonadota bacterium]
MNERNLEELSALMDGETSELEVRRVLKNIEQDQAMCQKWARYQMVSAVLKGETRGQTAQWQQVDLSARISRALEDEPALSGIEPVAAPARRLADVLLKPFANVAVAASVSAAVILGWQSVNQQPVTAAGPVAMTPGVSGAVVASAPVATGLMPVAQTSGSYRPATVA